MESHVVKMRSVKTQIDQRLVFHAVIKSQRRLFTVTSHPCILRDQTAYWWLALFVCTQHSSMDVGFQYSVSHAWTKAF